MPPACVCLAWQCEGQDKNKNYKIRALIISGMRPRMMEVGSSSTLGFMRGKGCGKGASLVLRGHSRDP